MKCRQHMAKVAELECWVCGIHGVQVHHIRHPAFSGAGQKAGDIFTMAMCKPCHDHFHKIGRKKWEMAHGRQIDIIEKTLLRIFYE